MSRPAFACALACALALAVAGCDEETSPTDSGPTPGVDSGPTPGVDSGPTGGVDSGPTGGTDSGPTGGTDSGPTGGTDAGPEMAADAGPPPACTMGRIRIQNSCGTFTACGGDPIGNWCYSDVCVSRQELVDQVAGTPGIPAECTTGGFSDLIDIRSSSGTISGTATVTATTVSRTVSNSTQGSFWIPLQCAVANSCSLTNIALSTIGMGISGSCVAESVTIDGSSVDGCLCDITFTSGISGTPESYTLDGNTMVTASGQRLDYCIDGSSNLVFRDASTDPQEPGIQTLLPDGT